MDRITASYLRSFCAEQSLPHEPEDTSFEHFANFCMVAQHYDDEFDVEAIGTGGGSDLGIDGFAVGVNGVLVASPEEVVDLAKVNGYLEVEFIFVQAKTSPSFDGGDISKFLDGVLEFFAETLTLPANSRIESARSIMSQIYSDSVRFKRGKPRLVAYYVSTGRWGSDPYLAAKLNKGRKALNLTGLFSDVATVPIGADELHKAYSRTTEAASAEFVFADKTLLPEIDGISEAYIGVVPISEFWPIIEDERHAIRKSLFIENVRDYLDSNPVNDRIKETLNSQERANFAVLNNGVTIVTRSLQATGNKFAISDYQVVNGCQTSHVLHSVKEDLDDSVTVPLKVIHTDDEVLITAIVTATNSQTTVTQEDLYALGAFQKKVEAFFTAHDSVGELYYERRSKQYNSASGIEKVRIISKSQLIRAFAAMFLDDAHRANRYYVALKGLVGSSIFGSEHSPEAYYTAAYAYYKLEYLFRNGAIPVAYKPARYHLLMAARHIAAPGEVPDQTHGRLIERYCKPINELLWDETKSVDLFRSAADVVDKVFGPPPVDKDSFKTQRSTEAVIDAVKGTPI
ncbi:MAG: AIPR family protein [Candidatus Microthrix subdominans]